jgi:hypothetical protein
MVELEYRLYYDDAGRVITYTTEKLEGNYIVITREQYSECRMDVVVVEGKIVRTERNRAVYVLEKNTGGVKTSKYDINIIINDGDGNYWKLTTYERYSQ